MPLTLTKDTVVKGTGIPVYQQLANHLRQAILTGELAPGEPLPSAKEITQATGISREPVLRALDVLKGEGLTVSSPGWPTKVAERRQPRLMGPKRYRELLRLLRSGQPLPWENALTLEHGARWADYSEDRREFAQEAATPLDRELLQLADGADIWRRRFVRSLHGKPYEIVRSAIPTAIAAGTILMDIGAPPEPGGTLEPLFHAGYDPHLAWHILTGRAPSPLERELLGMQSADWVHDLLEVFIDANGMPIQAARTIMPMSGTILEFETDFSST